jgi:hypothetical protein
MLFSFDSKSPGHSLANATDGLPAQSITFLLHGRTSKKQVVVFQFDVAAAEPVPIRSGGRHVVRQLTDKLAATFRGLRLLGIALAPRLKLG